MDFDYQSMRLRATMLAKSGGVTVKLSTGILVALNFVGWVLCFTSPSTNSANPVYIALGLFVVASYLKYGYTEYILSVAREENPQIGVMFRFITQRPISTILLMVLRPILLLVAFMLFYVPAFFMYAGLKQLYYIGADAPRQNIFKSIAKSMGMAKGNIRSLVTIDVRHLLEFALSIFTLGLSDLYFKPIRTIVYAEYYDYLKGIEEMKKTTWDGVL